MRRIIAIVGVAIAVFLAFTTYSVHTSIQGSAQLTQVRDMYFPVLERVDANIVRLDKMEEQFMQAVMTGERDPLDTAKTLHEQADKAFAEIGTLYVAHADEVIALRAQFKQYLDLATSTSTAILDKSVTDAAGSAAAMNGALEALRGSVKAFRQSSYDSFVSTLANTQKAARTSLLLGIALGVMNLCFMGVLVYFIRNNLKMMAVIAEQNATLEQRVAERTAQLWQKTNDIAAMLENMSLGVCTVVQGNRIHPEFSRHLTVITDSPELAHAPVMSGIFKRSDLGDDRRNQVEVALDSIVGEDAMMFDFNSHLLPAETRLVGLDGSMKIVQMEWSPIVNQAGQIEKVLLILQDVTRLRALELASAAQRQELEMIGAILKVPPGRFNEFIETSRGFAARCRELIAQTRDTKAEVLAELFRNMHTIKGNARTFGFALITDAAHLAEQSYDRLRKDLELAWLQDELLQELAAVENAVERTAKVNDETLGRKGRAADLQTSRGAFISHAELESLRASVAALARRAPGDHSDAVLQTIRRLGQVPLSRLLSGPMDAMAAVAGDLGKPVPALEIEGADTAFDPVVADTLKNCFVHLVRNALDHGIEPPDERVAAGKPEQGVLRVQCSARADRTELRISDDGRGLALHRLLDKGREAGVFQPGQSPTRAEVAEVIFLSGLSTAAELTQVSGRGVGMDAVRAFLHEQQGAICIELSAGSGDVGDFGFTPFAFVITLPAGSSTAAPSAKAVATVEVMA